MERYKVINELYELFTRFRYHEDVLDEVMDLVVDKGAGVTKKFHALLEKNLNMIEIKGREATQLKNFEKLKGVKDLYAMKFKGDNMNIRILFFFDGESYVVLLCCFDEKSDSGQNSYRKHIPVALERMEKMREKNEN